MLIIGCDFHTHFQQIAMAEDSTGELLVERRLDHKSGEGARLLVKKKHARTVFPARIRGSHKDF